MPLLNYTTKVPVSRSIDQIQKALIKAGARSVMFDYDSQGNINAVAFKIILSGNAISFVLPGRTREVLEVMKHDGTPHSYVNDEQAQRVAWRIIKDWVEAQMAIVATNMVSLPQVFLPYAVDSSGVTLFEKVSVNPELLLGDGR